MLSMKMRNSNRARVGTPAPRYSVVFAAMVAMAMIVGCGSEDGPPGGTIGGGNNLKLDGGADDTGAASDVDTPDVGDAESRDDADGVEDADASDEDAEAVDSGDVASTCPETPCGDGQVCAEGECVEETLHSKCLAAQDLGELQLDAPVNVTGTLLGRSDLDTTTCNQAAGGEEIYRFRVAEDAELHFSASWNGQFDGVVDFRKADCVSGSTSAEMCFDVEADSFVAEAGTDYYMVVEHSVGRANNYEVTLQASAIACIPGEVSCSSQTLQRCSGGGLPTAFNCADQCTTNSSGDQACSGNSCADAIDVLGGGTFIGDVNAYDSNVDFGQVAGCDVDGTTVNTPGAEVVFKLSGVPAGQQFEIDVATNDQNNNAIFITSNCSRAVDLNCVGSYFTNETPTWTAPADGDYWVFVDKTSNTGQTFHYKISAVDSSN